MSAPQPSASLTAQPTPEDKARYESLKKELVNSLKTKRELDKKLALIEVEIYTEEEKYLTETLSHAGGNIISGFEGYLKSQSARKRYEISDNDRLFSNSSLTLNRSLDMLGDGEDFEKDTTGSSNIISVPPATRASQDAAAQQKKLKRDAEYQRRRRATGRGRSTTADNDSEEEIVLPTAVTSSGRRPTKRQRLGEE